MLFPQSEGFLAAARPQDAVSIQLEAQSDHAADGCFIFDHEDCLPAPWSVRHEGIAWGRHRFCQGRKIDPKKAAPTQLAGYLDPTLVLLRNSIDDRQPQARRLAHFLRGEERVEGVFQGVGIHAATRVGH